ncbi:MAG: PrsW family intramembrane metalloprotease [Bacteroidales bacterium]|nr:PrsW family intramembrane metalloprotease [Bacteroidales bacterium]
MNLLVLSIAPVIIILVYIYIRDKYEKEPWGLLLKALLVGALTTIPILLVEIWLKKYIIYFTGLHAAAYNAFIVAAFTEELFKFLALYYLIWRNKEFNEKFDGIVYAVFISLGFALVENIMYVFEYGQSTGIMRALTAVPAHAIFGITMGYYFGLAKFTEKNRTSNLVSALLIPIILHGIYDFILMSQHQMYLLIFIPFIFYLWRSGFKKMKILSNNSRFKNKRSNKEHNFEA